MLMHSKRQPSGPSASAGLAAMLVPRRSAWRSFWKSAAILSLVIALATQGCGLLPTRIEYVGPTNCAPAPQPALPYIDAYVLKERVGEEMFAKLSLREKRLVDWAIENRDVLASICTDPEATDEQ